MSTRRILAVALLLPSLCLGCDLRPGPSETSAQTVTSDGQPRIGVLLASHGSHSPQWRAMLNSLEDAVRDELLADVNIDAVMTAFMEYTEPSIATRMQEFDDAGFSDVIVIPLFLTVSSHSFDDIPTILHLKEDATSIKMLKAQDIGRYRPRAKVTMAPELDFSGFLHGNIQRRVEAMSTDAAAEGVALIAYGSSAYNEEWEQLLSDIGADLESRFGMGSTSFGWCGHIVSYEQQSTQEAVRSVLAEEQRALVVPVLVAYDEMFQTDIIGGAIENLEPTERERVRYVADAILPDAQLEDWVIEVAVETAAGLRRATNHDLVEATAR